MPVERSVPIIPLFTGSRLTYSFDIILKLHSYGSGPAFKTLSKREVLKILVGNLTYFMKLRCKQTLNFPAKYDIYARKLITLFQAGFTQ